MRQRVERALAMVRMSELAGRLPRQLSGGQQQRVALARASVYDPPVLLMDEPLGALDKNLREELQDEIRQFHRQVGATIIYVTHDQAEAARAGRPGGDPEPRPAGTDRHAATAVRAAVQRFRRRFPWRGKPLHGHRCHARDRRRALDDGGRPRAARQPRRERRQRGVRAAGADRPSRQRQAGRPTASRGRWWTRCSPPGRCATGSRAGASRCWCGAGARGSRLARRCISAGSGRMRWCCRREEAWGFAPNPTRGQSSSGHLDSRGQGDDCPLAGAGQSPAASNPSGRTPRGRMNS